MTIIPKSNHIAAVPQSTRIDQKYKCQYIDHKNGKQYLDPIIPNLLGSKLGNQPVHAISQSLAKTNGNRNRIKSYL